MADAEDIAEETPALLVVTQTEKELVDKVLKIVSGSARVNPKTGMAVIEIVVPGVFDGLDMMTSNGRFIESGTAWFDTPEAGDKVFEISLLDRSGRLGKPGRLLNTYHDNESEDAGWFIPLSKKEITVEAIGGVAFLPSSFVLRISAKKGKLGVDDTFYVNIKWGKRDA